MWIRSQNREFLINAKRIVIIVIDEGRAEIRGNEYILGTYKTYERAIEVLDEIQNCIWNVLNGEPQIYPMPQK